MPDTLIEEVPPTLREPEVAAPQGEERAGSEPPRPPRRPVSMGKLAVLVIVLFTLLFALGGAAIYVFFIRYVPTAQRHISGNANLVLRAELSQVALFGPVRKHLWPLLEEKRPATAKAPASTLGERLQAETGVNPVTDVRELLIASSDATSWVALLGGRLTPGKVVPGLDRLAKQEGWAGWRREGELFVGPLGVAIGQADDGTVAFGSDAAIVTAALPASDDYQRLGLPQQGTVVFALTHEAWSGASGVLGAAVEHAGVLRKIDRATGSLTLSDAPALAMRLEPTAGADAAALAADLERALEELRLLSLLLPDVAGEKAAMRAAQVSPSGTGVDLRAPWPYEGLDRGCDRLATVLRALGAGK